MAEWLDLLWREGGEDRAPFEGLLTWATTLEATVHGTPPAVCPLPPPAGHLSRGSLDWGCWGGVLHGYWFAGNRQRN